MNNARRKAITAAAAILEEARSKFEEALEAFRTVAEEEREAFDNMPESLQSSERGEQSSAAADALEEIVSDLEAFDFDDMAGRAETAAE